MNTEFLINIPSTPPSLKEFSLIRLFITSRVWDLFPLWAQCSLCSNQIKFKILCRMCACRVDSTRNVVPWDTKPFHWRHLVCYKAAPLSSRVLLLSRCVKDDTRAKLLKCLLAARSRSNQNSCCVKSGVSREENKSASAACYLKGKPQCSAHPKQAYQDQCETDHTVDMQVTSVSML